MAERYTKTATPSKNKPRTKRRRIRSAPAAPPPVPLCESLKAKIESLAGPTLVPAVLETLKDGCLPTTPLAFQQFEGCLLELARKHVVGAILEEVLKAIHDHEDFVLWSMGRAQREERLGSSGDRTPSVQVAGGRVVELETPYMQPLSPSPKEPGRRRGRGSRGQGGGGLFPVLAVLGFVCRVSPYLASLTARTTAQLDSHEEAVQTLKIQGYSLDVDAVRRISARAADAGIVARELEEDGDRGALAGKRVVVCYDGGRLRYRMPKPGRPRKSGRHGYTTPWREPKIMTVYTVDEKGRKTQDKPIYETTLAPWKDAMAQFAKTLKRFGVKEAKVLAISADGSDNIWREIDELISLVEIDPSRVVRSVDFYHAAGYIAAAVKLSAGLDEKQRQQLITKQCKLLKRGRAAIVIRTLEALQTANAEDAEELAGKVEYLRKRIDMLRYDELQEQGLPIGTGAVESTVRRVNNHRLKGPGIFWKPENAERMLYLRSRLKADRWLEVEAALHRAALKPARTVAPKCFSKLTE